MIVTVIESKKCLKSKKEIASKESIGNSIINERKYRGNFFHDRRSAITLGKGSREENFMKQIFMSRIFASSYRDPYPNTVLLRECLWIFPRWKKVIKFDFSKIRSSFRREPVDIDVLSSVQSISLNSKYDDKLAIKLSTCWISLLIKFQVIPLGSYISIPAHLTRLSKVIPVQNYHRYSWYHQIILELHHEISPSSPILLW